MPDTIAIKNGKFARLNERPVFFFTETRTITFDFPQGYVYSQDDEYELSLDVDADVDTGPMLRVFGSVDTENRKVTFVLPFYGDEVKERINGRDTSVMLVIQLARVSNTTGIRHILLHDTVLCIPAVDDGGDGSEVLPDAEQQPANAHYTVQELDDLLATAPLFQFSADGEEWHDEQDEDDVFIRFSNAETREVHWSGPIRFMPADFAEYVQRARQAALDAEAGATLAESWAVGNTNTRTGEDTNNSKYYSEQSAAQASNASNSASTATAKATLAESYAKGGTGTRSGEDADNAKHYSEQSAASASEAASSAASVAEIAELSESYAKGGTGTRPGEDADNSKYYSEQSARQAAGAASSATIAGEKAVLSESYAKGGTGTRTGEDTDNSKFYSEGASSARDESISAKNVAVSARNDASASQTAAALSASDSQGFATAASNSARTASARTDAALNAARSAAADALAVAGYVELAQTTRQDVETVQRLKSETQALHDSIMAVVAEYYIGPAYGYGLVVDGTRVSFTWTDPSDTDVVKWAKTRLVFKQGGFPEDETDGTILVDNVLRNQYRTEPFTHDFGSAGNYYFALFTQSTAGRWNTGDDAPRFTTDTLTWATIGMLSRTGALLSYPGMAIGSVVPLQVNSLYPKMRYRLAHIDYSGAYGTVGEYMLDNTIRHNSIWIPYYLPSLGDANIASRLQFDASELEYAGTWDEEFITGKTYSVLSGENTYTALVAGTDYAVGESVEIWQMAHGTTVFTKNDARRRNYGYNRWKESNMRQWLNASGDNWFSKQNEYDVLSSNADYGAGWLTGMEPGFLSQAKTVRNKTVRNSVSILDGGAGGGSDITEDVFWLPSRTELFGVANVSVMEGAQFAYFRDVATTNAQRVQYGEDGNAYGACLRTTFTTNTNAIYYLSTGGIGSTTNANASFSFMPTVCLA